MAAPQQMPILPAELRLMIIELPLLSSGPLANSRLILRRCPLGGIDWDSNAIMAALRYGPAFWRKVAVQFTSVDVLKRVCQPHGLLQANLRYLKFDTGCAFRGLSIISSRNGPRPTMLRAFRNSASQITSLQVLVLMVEMKGSNKPTALIDRMYADIPRHTPFEVRIVSISPYRTPSYSPPARRVYQADLTWAAIRAPNAWHYSIVREIAADVRVCFECGIDIGAGAAVHKCTVCNLTSFCSIACRNTATASSTRHTRCCIEQPNIAVLWRLQQVSTWDGLVQY